MLTGSAWRLLEPVIGDRGSGLAQALLDGVNDGLQAPGDVQLAEDTAQVRLNGLLADEERLGNILIRTPRREETQDLLLSRGQSSFRTVVRVLPLDMGEGISSQESRDQLPLNPRISLVHALNSLSEIRGARILRQVSARPGLQGRQDHLLIRGAGEDERLGVWALPFNGPDQLGAVRPRYADIKEGDIRSKVFNDGDRREPVGCLAHDLDALLPAEYRVERFPK